MKLWKGKFLLGDSSCHGGLLDFSLAMLVCICWWSALEFVFICTSVLSKTNKAKKSVRAREDDISWLFIFTIVMYLDLQSERAVFW